MPSSFLSNILLCTLYLILLFLVLPIYVNIIMCHIKRFQDSPAALFRYPIWVHLRIYWLNATNFIFVHLLASIYVKQFWETLHSWHYICDPLYKSRPWADCGKELQGFLATNVKTTLDGHYEIFLYKIKHQ